MRAEVVGGNPSPEQVAAIVAALTVIEAERAAAAAAAPAPDEHGSESMWVEASRRSAQRSGMQRGPWRLSGRIGMRSRV
jgi:Acyl-CoA carboxylase epsilon subunit